MSIKIENLNFFNKKGDNLNLYYDSAKSLYRGNYVLSEQTVSVGLIESEQIIVLEKVYNESNSTFEYTKLTSTINDESELFFEIDENSQNEFFFYDITLDDDNVYYINKEENQTLIAEYNSNFTDYITTSGTYTNIPISYDISKLKKDYDTINIGFSSDIENSFIGKVHIYSKTNITKTKIAEINLFVDTVAEDTRLPLLLETMGQTLNNKDFLIFDTTNIKEEEIDFNIMNKKRKELLLEFSNIFPYLGSYKALINIIKYFGYESLSIKEYWKNVKVDSQNFGKYRPVDVESVLLNSNNIEQLSDLFPSKIYKKTNNLGLYYQITQESGEYDEDGLPITEEVFQFTIEEILIKLYALKEKLKKYFLPLNSRIIDIVGEALYYTKIELNYWNSFNRIDDVNINIKPTFNVLPSEYGFIEDLRPLEWIGAKIGNDLKLNGTTNLKVREFTLTNSFYDNKLKIYDDISKIGAEITAYYQSTDEDNMRRLYEELLKLGAPFTDYYINLNGTSILFVERRVSPSDILSEVKQGRYASTPPTLSYIDIFNGTNAVSNYGNAYLGYFFDRNFDIFSLSNNEGISVGYPILLKNTSFEVTWDNAEVTWNSLDEQSEYKNFNFSSDNNFPTGLYNSGDDPTSGVSWDNFGDSNFYELEWVIWREADANFPYWEQSFKNIPRLAKEWAVILPYAGNYNVQLTLYDLYGSYSRCTKENFITVEQKNPDFTVWKVKDLYELSWDELESVVWDQMGASWDLPFLPNTTNEEVFIQWHTLDRVEFYQNLVVQNAVYKSLFDINGYTWKNIPDETTWEDFDHLYWDETSPAFTKFYIEDLTGTTFGVSVKDEHGNILETISFTRNTTIPNIYIDFIDQVYELDPNIYPIFSSFIYEYRIILDYPNSDIEKIVAVSKQFEKPLRFYFNGNNCNTSTYNSILNGYGVLGDSPSSFDIYGTGNTLGITTNTPSEIEIDGLNYEIPANITTLEDLNDHLNNVSPFVDWEFNIVKAYNGLPSNPTPGTYLPKYILASKLYHSADDESIIKYNNIYGTKYARSITTNVTWNSLDVIYYQKDIKPMSQLYFSYDISKMPGYTSPTWKITNSKTGELIFEWNNRYMVYLFTEEGEYTVSLDLKDTNGNTKTVTKNGIVRVVKNY